MPAVVSLAWDELLSAAQVGIMRQAMSLRDGKEHQYGYAPKLSEEWGTHIVGAQAEMAVAKLGGLYFPASVNAPKSAPDLYPNVQVRVRKERSYRLMVRPNDIPEHYYVSVYPLNRERGRMDQQFEVYGFIRGSDAMTKGALEDPQGRGKPAYFVNDSDLTLLEPSLR